MNYKSYIPFVTLPASVVMLTTLAIDAVSGKFDVSRDIPRYSIWGVLCSLWLVTGLIKWNKPYITADDSGLTVRGRWFSNQPSFVMPWAEIKGHRGRTFYDIKIELLDGELIKIPINGMSGKSLRELLSYIETKAGSANDPTNARRETRDT